MANIHSIKRAKRALRHSRVRSKVSGTGVIPRLAVFRSLKHIYGQLVDDSVGKTLVSARSSEVKQAGKKIDIADAVGKLLAEKAKAKGITKAVFDRGGYQYHGRVKAVADGARAAGLEF